VVGLAIRKVTAANDVYHHVMGTIDTPEKYEAKRLDLAKRVWKRMEETDSKECRHCHDSKAMDSEKQGKTAWKQHQKMFAGERTCIDCHYGIAHKEPAGGLEPRDALAN
jgi:cytochrome c-type protein NapC